MERCISEVYVDSRGIKNLPAKLLLTQEEISWPASKLHHDIDHHHVLAALTFTPFRAVYYSFIARYCMTLHTSLIDTFHVSCLALRTISVRSSLTISISALCTDKSRRSAESIKSRAAITHFNQHHIRASRECACRGVISSVAGVLRPCGYRCNGLKSSNNVYAPQCSPKTTVVDFRTRSISFQTEHWRARQHSYWQSKDTCAVYDYSFNVVQLTQPIVHPPCWSWQSRYNLLSLLFSQCRKSDQLLQSCYIMRQLESANRPLICLLLS